MNKTFALLFSLLFLGASVFAQDDKAKKVELSLRVAPMVSMTGVIDESKDWELDNGDSKLKFSGGISLDKFFQENVALGTGLWYSNKRSTVKYESLDEVYAGTADYNLQYIDIPLMLKGFTNNVTEKMKIYFQVGGTFGIKVGERYAGSDINNKPSSNTYAKWYDTSFLIGSGVELNIGTSNKVYAGIDYSHGLTNIVKDDYFDGLDNITTEEAPKKNDYKIKNSTVSLVIGFKF
jgi:hypothetical protein